MESSAHSTPKAALRAAVREVSPPDYTKQDDLGRFVSEVIDNLEGYGWHIYRPEPGTRAVLINTEFFMHLGGTDVRWGVPNEQGFYTPIVTALGPG
jgi:hypothetical protein